MATLFFSDEPASEDFRSAVKIDAIQILMEYVDDGIVQYCGSNSGDGHFELHAPEVEGRALCTCFQCPQLLRALG